MARNTTIDTDAPKVDGRDDEVAHDSGFGSEFRELARQRRFVRASRSSLEAAAATSAIRSSSWRDAAAPAAPPAQMVPAAPVASAVPVAPVPQRVDVSQLVQELSKVTGQLVQSREQLAAAIARAAHAETSLAAANDRLMASHLIVREAQAAIHASAERVKLLEGRCEMLKAALELSVNASFVTRWRWRREQRRAAHAAPAVD